MDHIFHLRLFLDISQLPMYAILIFTLNPRYSFSEYENIVIYLKVVFIWQK